jgi:hypothetical protein
VVLVQDYHLCLVAPWCERSAPTCGWCTSPTRPSPRRHLGRDAPRKPRAPTCWPGLAAHHACGFHSARWEADFRASCRAGRVAPATFVAPLGPRPRRPRGVVGRPGAQAARRARRAGRRPGLLVRVDRIELSKNVLRGFEAYEQLLAVRAPTGTSTVVFGAFVYPSRQGSPTTTATPGRGRAGGADQRPVRHHRWTPMHYDPTDDYPRSVAALARADAVLVNPIRDGLNLVAMEAMLVNQRDGQLVLSPQAGAWDVLGAAGAWPADPFDVGSTAAALGRPSMPRARGADRAAARRLAPRPHWLATAPRPTGCPTPSWGTMGRARPGRPRQVPWHRPRGRGGGAIVAAGTGRRGARTRQVPMSDGGEGFTEAFGGANRSAWSPDRSASRSPPAGGSVGKTAVIEMAQASGLALVGGAEGNDPVAASTGARAS